MNPENQVIRLGFLGLGNIGAGVYRLLRDRADEIRAQEGIGFEVTRILVRDLQKPRKVEVPTHILTTDSEQVVASADVDVVVEFLGGQEPASSLLIRALAHGKPIVTANKMALASSWQQIMQTAMDHRTPLLFEASVCGAIPILRGLIHSMQANRIDSLTGIVNGTTNYILTAMQEEGLAYAEALEKAQELGLAEPDPTADVEGFDAVYKLSILAALAFHRHVQPTAIHREGITRITQTDIQRAKEWGYAIKLLAHGSVRDGQLSLRVHPSLVAKPSPLASVAGALNCVCVSGHASGDLTWIGLGAGDAPTASAVVSDLIEIAKGGGYLPTSLKAEATVSDDWDAAFYLSICVPEGKRSQWSMMEVLARYGVEVERFERVEAIIPTGWDRFVLLTNKGSTKAVQAVKKELEEGLGAKVTCIHVADL